MKQKFTVREKMDLIILFLFALAFLNRSGYIFAGLLVMYFFLDAKWMSFGMSEVYLLVYGSFYYIFYMYHFTVGINEVIWYLVGPIGAFLIGKVFVRRSQRENAFLAVLLMVSLGMCVHGLLNWYAYRTSQYAVNYGHLRLSVDFWRRDLVSVTSTGMLFSFGASVSTGFCFSDVRPKYKLFFATVLVACLAATISFANRTLLVIILILFVVELILTVKQRHHDRNKLLRWAVVACIAFFLCCIMILTDIGYYILSDIMDIKLVNRIQEIDSIDPRLYAWVFFFRDFNFLKYPLGGNAMLESGLYLADGTKLNYFHNLWLDVHNVVGIFPTFFLIMYTVRAFQQYCKFQAYAKKTEHVTMINTVRCWSISILLNCFVEPVTQGNPYYFLMILMCLGALEEQTKKMQKEANDKLL